jgi:hypothetical protein
MKTDTTFIANITPRDVVGRNDRHALRAVALYLAPVLTLLVQALLSGGLGKALDAIYVGSDMLQRPVE